MLPIFVGAAAVVALLLTYPYGTLTVLTLLYLGTIPLSYQRFQRRLYEPAAQAATSAEPISTAQTADLGNAPTGETKH